MRKIKTLIALALVCLAFTVGATVSAFAGINTNNPGGNGLIDNSEINMENFIVNEEAEKSAYSLQLGNRTYVSTGHTHENGIFSHVNPIPEADLVNGTKVVYQFDVYNWESYWGSYFRMSLFNNALWMANNVITTRFDCNYFAGANPANLEVYTVAEDGTETKVENLAAANYGIGLNTSVLNNQKKEGREYATYWIELDVGAQTLTVYAGNKEANVKKKYSVWKNAFEITPGFGSYFCSFAFACSTEPSEIDNFMVYSVKDGVEKVYENYTFDQDESLNTYYGKGSGAYKSYDTSIIVNDPVADANINSINPLKVDTRLEKTFELSAGYIFNTMATTRKVGIAFGLDNYDTALSAPVGGASFLYFTVNEEGKIVIGADNIAEDGTATAVGTAAVTDIALDSKVVVNVVGNPDNSVTVTVNGTEYTFEGFKLNGHIGFAQTGTGSVAYKILPADFAVTGFFLTVNEGEAESATFDAEYINSVKFATQFSIAPSEYCVKQETTVGEIDGLTTTGGRLNFRGTSTNTRVTFAQPYADFVFQFDYISEPFATRAIPGGLPTAGTANRYSPLYVIFGSDQTISELKATYALGIIEANATQYFWGAETLLISEGKLGTGTATVLSNAIDATEDYDAPINGHYIGEAGIYTKPIMPNPESKYSMYNKTTRCKLVVINNNVAFYVAEVAEDGTVGEYILAYTNKVANSFGYVGFGTDAPGWAAVDNVAITPISTEKAIELGLDAVPAVDLVPDVAIADMETDYEPTPIAKTEISVDTEAKKVAWTAVEGAKEYEVTVSFNGEAIIEQTVAGLELDISSLAQYGEYNVAVVVVPEDPEKHFKSRTTSTFTLEDPNKPTVEPSTGACNGSVSAIGLGAVVLVLGAIFAKRRENR